MVMKFTLTPLSHYNSITKPYACFLLSLLEDLSIDFPSHFIISILDVYLDMATHDKLIFPSTITRILQHFSIPIPNSHFFTTIGAISVSSIWRSKAQLRLEWPRVNTDDPAAFAIPPSSSAPPISSPSSSVAGVTLEAIMVQFQQMEADFGGCLDYLTNEMCQINTRVSHITRRQAHLSGFAPSLEALTDEDVDAGDDNEDDASSSSDSEMTISQ